MHYETSPICLLRWPLITSVTEHRQVAVNSISCIIDPPDTRPRRDCRPLLLVRASLGSHFGMLPVIVSLAILVSAPQLARAKAVGCVNSLIDTACLFFSDQLVLRCMFCRSWNLALHLDVSILASASSAGMLSSDSA
jgi:hypothetical protein